jgi:hypothetical protein
MKDSSSRRRFGDRAPWGLLGMLALMALAERFVVWHDLDFASPLQWDWRLTSRAARHEATAGAILCFGDSLIKGGVQPRILEDRLGLRVYNLAVSAGMAPADYFLLRRALGAGARPAAVLLEAEPHLLSLGPRFLVDQWPELLGVGEALDLAWTERDADLGTRILLGKLLPSVRGRAQIRGAVLATVRGRPGSNRYETPHFWRNWRVNAGAQVLPVLPDFRGAVEPWHGEWFPPDWRCDRGAAAYLRRFLALAAARGIRVFWILPPVCPEAQALRDRNGLDAEHTRLVHLFQGRFPGVVVIDGRRLGYGPSAFTDPFHLNRRGSAAFSAEVADVLRHALAGPPAGATWVGLPPRRMRAIATPLEDLMQSHYVQRDLKSRRRR